MIILESHAQSRGVRHVGLVAFRCARCHVVKPVQTSGGTGYGMHDDGGLICYACCAEDDRAYMREHGRNVLYLTGREGQWRVTNWPGTLVIKPSWVRKGRHNIARTRYDVWFYFEGDKWHGVNIGDNQILRCRRLKRS